MSGFYGWRENEKEDGNQPFFISAIDGGALSCAGLWDTWNDLEKGEQIRSATVIVTEANSFTAQISHCMPVFLPPNRIEAWLDGIGGMEMLTPLPPGTLRAWPVS